MRKEHRNREGWPPVTVAYLWIVICLCDYEEKYMKHLNITKVVLLFFLFLIPSGVVKAATHEHINVLRSVKHVNVIVEQSYPNDRKFNLPFVDDTKRLLNYARVKTVAMDSKNNDALLKIEAKGEIIGGDPYTTNIGGHWYKMYKYLEASLEGTILFEIPGGAIYRDDFRGIGRTNGSSIVYEFAFGEAYKKSYVIKLVQMITKIYGVDPLIAALQDNDRDIRAIVVKELGRIGDVRSVKPLITILVEGEYNDRDVQISAAWSLGEMKAVEAVEPLIAVLKRYMDGHAGGNIDRLITESTLALEKITGQHFGIDTIKWQNWWESGLRAIAHGQEDKHLLSDIKIAPESAKTEMTFSEEPNGKISIKGKMGTVPAKDNHEERIVLDNMFHDSAVHHFKGKVPGEAIEKIEGIRVNLSGYVFEGSIDQPLTFRCVLGKGYVYLDGNGTVTMKDGSVVKLGRDSPAPASPVVSLPQSSENQPKAGNLPATSRGTPLQSVENLALGKLGLYVQDLTPQLAKQLNLWWVKSGVLITDVQKNSPAAEVDIKKGYVLVSVGQNRINNIEELGALLKIMPKGDVWEMCIVWSDKFGEHQGYARIKIR